MRAEGWSLFGAGWSRRALKFIRFSSNLVSKFEFDFQTKFVGILTKKGRGELVMREWWGRRVEGFSVPDGAGELWKLFDFRWIWCRSSGLIFRPNSMVISTKKGRDELVMREWWGRRVEVFSVPNGAGEPWKSLDFRWIWCRSLTLIFRPNSIAISIKKGRGELVERAGFEVFSVPDGAGEPWK